MIKKVSDDQQTIIDLASNTASKLSLTNCAFGMSEKRGRVTKRYTWGVANEQHGESLPGLHTTTILLNINCSVRSLSQKIGSSRKRTDESNMHRVNRRNRHVNNSTTEVETRWEEKIVTHIYIHMTHNIEIMELTIHEITWKKRTSVTRKLNNVF